MMRHVLVTGSRRWIDYGKVAATLRQAIPPGREAGVLIVGYWRLAIGPSTARMISVHAKTRP